VLDDLSPYFCVFANCPNAEARYHDTKLLRQHMKDVHCDFHWECPRSGTSVECSVIFTDPESLETHLKGFHQQNLSISDMNLIRQHAVHRTPHVLQACVFCNGHGREVGDDDIKRHWDTLIAHMTREHMQALAMLSLPWDLGQSEKSSDSRESGDDSSLMRMEDDFESDSLDMPKDQSIIVGIEKNSPKDTAQHSSEQKCQEWRDGIVEGAWEDNNDGNDTIFSANDDGDDIVTSPVNECNIAVDSPVTPPQATSTSSSHPIPSEIDPDTLGIDIRDVEWPGDTMHPDGLLYLAAYDGNLEAVRQLLGHADLNAQGGGYGNALCAASRQGKQDVVRMLIDAGADVNARVLCKERWQLARGEEESYMPAMDDVHPRRRLPCPVSISSLHGRGFSKSEPQSDSNDAEYCYALGVASFGSSTAVIQTLIDAGADVHAQGYEYGDALSAASSQYNAATVRLLLDAGANVNAQGGLFGNALQMTCADWTRQKTDEVRHSSGASGDAKEGASGDALASSLSQSVSATVVILLDAGANINAQGGLLGSALQAAAHTDQLEIVRLLIDRGADINSQGGSFGNALQAAARLGRLEIVRLLLDNGADINSQGGNFGNALQATAYTGSLEIVKFLIDRGADINSQGGQFGNALQAAVAGTSSSAELVVTLLDAGADLHAQGGNYGNVLQAAAKRCQVEYIKLFIERGVDVNAHGGQFGSALQAAAHFDRDGSAVSMLLDAGADVDAQNGKYGHPLHSAAFQDNDPAAKLLLNKGARVDAQGGVYGTALQAASCRGNDKVAQTLLDAGADINAVARGSRYGNALQAACIEGRYDVVRLLLDTGADMSALGAFGNAIEAAAYGRRNFLSTYTDRRGSKGWRGYMIKQYEAVEELLLERSPPET
jgi:ankyrin repeat protein